MGLGLASLTFFGEAFYKKYGSGSRKLEAEVFHEMINKSKRMIMIGAGDQRKQKFPDVRVRVRRKVKRPKKVPPFPYVQ